MIWESSFWKDDLLKIAENLRKRKTQRRWSEVSRARVEQSVMTGFYSVRKLIEAKKVSDDTASRKTSITTYQAIGKPVTLTNWHRLEELYDFDRHSTEVIKLNDLANQFIHSYVFTLAFEENAGLDSIFFCSDWRRNRKLQRVAVDSLIEIFIQVGKDYPNSVHYTWEEKDLDYDVCSATRHGHNAESGGTK